MDVPTRPFNLFLPCAFSVSSPERNSTPTSSTPSAGCADFTSTDAESLLSTRFESCFLFCYHYATAMKSLHIRDVPDVVIDRLKRRAQQHHRSLQGELRALLTEVAGRVEADDLGEFTLHKVKTPGVQNWSREGIYED